MMDESFIGVLISIITRIGMRYEGVILQLHTQENIIVLGDVRVFGTEGRRMDVHVPPSNKIYEQITFHRSEVTDVRTLLLSDGRNPWALLPDPAIIQNHPQVPSSSHSLAPPSTLQGTNALQNILYSQGNLPPSHSLAPPSTLQGTNALQNIPYSQGNLPPRHSLAPPSTLRGTNALQNIPYSQGNLPPSHSLAPPSTLQGTNTLQNIPYSQGNLPPSQLMEASGIQPLNNNRPPLRTYLSGLTGLHEGSSYSQVLPFTPPSPGLSFRDKTKSLLDSGPSTLTADPMMSDVGTSSSRSSLPDELASSSLAKSLLQFGFLSDVKAENDARTTKNADKVEQLQKPPNSKMHEATSSSHYGNVRHIRGQGYGGMSRAYQRHRGRGQGQGQGQVMHESTSSSHYGQAYQSHRGRGQGTSQINLVQPSGAPSYRGNYGGINTGMQYEAAIPVTKWFSEDFDIESMITKFNKAEVCDALSKSNQADKQKADESDPVNKKDDFFDSFSFWSFGVPNPEREEERTPGKHEQGSSSQGLNRGHGRTPEREEECSPEQREQGSSSQGLYRGRGKAFEREEEGTPGQHEQGGSSSQGSYRGRERTPEREEGSPGQQGQVMHESTSSSQSQRGHGEETSQRNLVQPSGTPSYQYVYGEPITWFTEDFDYESMDKRFLKAEVRDASLSKSNPADKQKADEKSDSFGVQNPEREEERTLRQHEQGSSSQGSNRGRGRTPEREGTPGQHGQRSSSQGSYRGRGRTPEREERSPRQHWQRSSSQGSNRGRGRTTEREEEERSPGQREHGSTTQGSNRGRGRTPWNKLF